MEQNKEKSKQEKPKYESPVIVPLGEVAKGAGSNCNAGTANSGGMCTAGGLQAT